MCFYVLDSGNEPSEIVPIDLIVRGNGEIFLNNVQSQKSEAQSGKISSVKCGRLFYVYTPFWDYKVLIAYIFADKSLNKIDGSKKVSPTSTVMINPENGEYFLDVILWIILTM